MDKRYMAAINSVSKFINSVTSTKGGIIATYKKRADTFNKNFGTNFSWQDLANYFESGAFARNRENYGSDQALYLIGALTKPIESVKDDIFQAVSKYEKIPFEDENEAINAELAKLPGISDNVDKRLSAMPKRELDDYLEHANKFKKIKNSGKQLKEINKYLNRAKNNASKNRIVKAQEEAQRARRIIKAAEEAEEAKKKGKK